MPRGPQQLTVLHANHFPRCSAVIDKHFKGYSSVQFMEAGAVRLAYDGAAHVLEGAWFWFAMPGPRIRFSPAGRRPWSHRYIAFCGPLVDSWSPGFLPRRPVECPESERSRFAWLMDEILGRLDRDGKWAHAKTVNLIENLLIDIEALRHPVSRKQTGARRLARVVREAWERAPTEPLDYAALARKCGFALSTFRRRFAAETGIALHRFVMRLRIERARQFLIESDMTIERIAGASGFADVFYFTRCFTAIVGIAPAQYRRTRLFAE